jgi:hypothetical protein
VSRRVISLLAAWTVLLVIGFGAVFAAGGPLATGEDLLAAAYAPPTPVTEEVALSSADTIMRMEHPEFTEAERRIRRQNDFNDDRYVVTYSYPERGYALRIAISIASGRVRVQVTS